MQTLSDIRHLFIAYFKNHDHEVVSSSSVIPENDPTLMFTNAGMVQFKDVFTGQEQRPYTRAVSSQKCIRAGGKHNDLDNVGYTARHHTFFEMLGNFSFGDYFKEKAIILAWEFLTKELGLNPSKLLVTVYAEDTESAALWKKITGFEDHKIIKINTTDNFWSMGDTGACGPCTEIFYDHGENIFGGPPGSKDQDGDRFIEIWNIVFMQYFQKNISERISLDTQSVDTGMGLERIAAVLQGVHDNYEIDLFQHLIGAIQSHVGTKGVSQSYRVIADHLRSCAFMIAEGLLPSNEGRGYVLRRIMRRAMRHAHLLGAKEPLMHSLVLALTECMGQSYPELVQAQSFIENTFLTEEEKFRQTLEKGLRLLEAEKINMTGQILPGDVAFKLYDTYGFPLDLTQDILRNQDISVDTLGFDEAMQAQKDRARKAWSGSGDQGHENVDFDIKNTIPPTQFMGYETLDSDVQILAIIKDGAFVSQAQIGDKVDIFFNQTPFYAEAGGQVGDQGVFNHGPDISVDIDDCIKKFGTHYMHRGIVRTGSIAVGGAGTLVVNNDYRRKVAANHSATHLLHSALRSILGDHVVQKGSHVGADRLRFDFTYAQPLTTQEIYALEAYVNQNILSNQQAQTHVIPHHDAIQKGAIALFGEKYDDHVRVVSLGHEGVSMELCGGTHVHATGDIGSFKILSEAGIASGIRRIEAITGQRVIEYIHELEEKNHALELQFKEETLALNKQITKLKQQVIFADLDTFDAEKLDRHNVKWVFKIIHDVPAKELRIFADYIVQKQKGDVVLVLCSVAEGKISLMIATSKHTPKHIDAGQLIQQAVPYIGGKGGGGKPNMAQGGGHDLEKLKTLFQFLFNSMQEDKI